jgi:branched-chain amino acid transport system permease protein
MSTPLDATRRGRLALWIGLALLVAAPFLGLYPVFVMTALCYAIFACAFNLLLGYTGLLSFGHAAYFAAAAYGTGWLVRSAGWPPELAVVAGTAGAALLGFVVGSIAIRRQGIYFAMTTLALAQMVYFVFLQAPFTGGEDGLQGVARGKLLGVLPLAGAPHGKLLGVLPVPDDVVMYFVVLAVFVGVFLFIQRVVHSPYGQVLKAIRENEPRAVSLGYDVDRNTLLAFVLSTALAGLGGSLKTLVLGFASLSDAHWSLSGEVVLMTLLGGMGTFAGPVLGAFTIIGLQNLLADRVGEWVSVIIGAIFVACVVAFRRGFVGELLAWQQRRQARAGAVVSASASSASSASASAPSTSHPVASDSAAKSPAA